MQGKAILAVASFLFAFGLFYFVPTFAAIPFVKQFYFINETYNKSEVDILLQGVILNSSNGTVKNITAANCLIASPNPIVVNGSIEANITCINEQLNLSSSFWKLNASNIDNGTNYFLGAINFSNIINFTGKVNFYGNVTINSSTFNVRANSTFFNYTNFTAPVDVLNATTGQNPIPYAQANQTYLKNVGNVFTTPPGGTLPFIDLFGTNSRIPNATRNTLITATTIITCNTPLIACGAKINAIVNNSVVVAASGLASQIVALNIAGNITVYDTLTFMVCPNCSYQFVLADDVRTNIAFQYYNVTSVTEYIL